MQEPPRAQSRKLRIFTRTSRKQRSSSCSTVAATHRVTLSSLTTTDVSQTSELSHASACANTSCEPFTYFLCDRERSAISMSPRAIGRPSSRRHALYTTLRPSPHQDVRLRSAIYSSPATANTHVFWAFPAAVTAAEDTSFTDGQPPPTPDVPFRPWWNALTFRTHVRKCQFLN